MSELKKKQRQIREKKVLNREDVYHGALEDILLGRILFCGLSNVISLAESSCCQS